MMNHYKLKVGQYHGYTDIEVDIPKEIKFFYKNGVVGPRLNQDCEHYTTIVETEKYKKWIEEFINTFGVCQETMGKYTILTIYNLHNDTPIPTVDRNVWFKENNIDLGQYTFVTYDRDFRPMNAYKIIDFQDEWNVDVICVTIRDFFSSEEYFSVSRENVEWTNIKPSQMSNNRFSLKTYGGEKSKMIWNTMFAKAMQHFHYEPEYVDNSYDFLEVQKDLLNKIGFDSFEELRESWREKMAETNSTKHQKKK